ncbi:hypothetical protein HDU96_003786, partial [Phlyctochytrium bullatum]
MSSADPRYLLMVDPVDPQRSIYALRFFLPADRLCGPATFHPVLVTTVRDDTRELE